MEGVGITVFPLIRIRFTSAIQFVFVEKSPHQQNFPLSPFSGNINEIFPNFSLRLTPMTGD